MARWIPGQSGNPNGRPKKKRALTQALQNATNKVVTLSDGTRINGKRYIAGLALQAVTDGEITLANGTVLTLSPEDMMMFWKFLFTQIDGPPPQEHEVTGAEGGPITLKVIYGDRTRSDE